MKPWTYNINWRAAFKIEILLFLFSQALLFSSDLNAQTSMAYNVLVPSHSPSKVEAFNFSPTTECDQTHDLPVVTHWKEDVGVVEGASDQINLSNPLAQDQMAHNAPLKYVYNYNYLPTFNNYIGKNFSISSVSNEEATQFLNKLCIDNHQSYRLWKPSDFNGTKGIEAILNFAPRNSGTVLVISGLTVSDSMFAVILPSNWSPPKEGHTNTPYPILFNGFYDLNDNLFRLEGADMAKLVSESTKVNNNGIVGRGAIGVLWNGAGSAASRTVNEKAFSEFQLIMDLVAKLGADPHRIIGFGASRGGITPLQMASNPYPHNYTFRLIYSAVPPGHIGSIASVSSPTTPLLLSASDWTLGLFDSYKRSFIYPNVGNNLEGLSGPEAHVRVLTGAQSLKDADDSHSLGSERMIQALKNAGTQVYLEIASHDNIVPSFDQIWLYKQYEKAGIPLELRVNYLAGHFTDKTTRNSLLKKTMESYTHSSIPTHPKVNKGAKHFYKLSPQTNLLVPLKNPRFLLTLEFPRYLTPEFNGIIIATGEPGTQLEIIYSPPGVTIDSNSESPKKITMTLNSLGHSLFRFDPRTTPIGIYQVTGIKMKGPYATQWRSLPLNERTYLSNTSNEPFDIEILAEHPNGYGGHQAALSIMKGYLGESFEKSRSALFGNVTYGVVEPD